MLNLYFWPTLLYFVTFLLVERLVMVTADRPRTATVFVTSPLIRQIFVYSNPGDVGQFPKNRQHQLSGGFGVQDSSRRSPQGLELVSMRGARARVSDWIINGQKIWTSGAQFD